MAKSDYEPTARYRIKVARVVEINGVTIKPGAAEVVMSGKTCASIADNILEAVKLPSTVQSKSPRETVEAALKG